MNYGKRTKSVKEVQLRFEWTDKSDLTLILNDLKDLIASGVESYHGEKKSLENEDKWHCFEFEQFYKEHKHEEVESDINGELKLVIKSKI